MKKRITVSIVFILTVTIAVLIYALYPKTNDKVTAQKESNAVVDEKFNQTSSEIAGEETQQSEDTYEENSVDINELVRKDIADALNQIKKQEQNEVSIIDRTSDASAEQREKPNLCNEVAQELADKKWQRVEIIAGSVDSKEWGLIIDTTGGVADTNLYTVIGQIDGLYENPIHAVVLIAFDEETNTWEKRDAFYVSFAGRYLGENELEYFEYDEYITADDENLWFYMYCY